MERLGLIAGNGNFPLLFAREASSRGCAVTAVAHRDETDPALAALVDDLSWIRVGQVGRMINCFKQAGVSRAVMVGGINKVRSLASLRPDWRGLRLIAGAAGRGDDALLRALAAELEGEGIEVVSSTLFLDRLLVEAGHVKNVNHAFTRLIGDNGPAYIDNYRFPAGDCIDAIRQAGRVDLVAHPHLLNPKGPKLTAKLQRVVDQAHSKIC